MEVNAHGELLKFVDQFDTQKAAAKALGMTPAYLSDLVNCRRDLSVKVLKKLGLKRAIVPVNRG